MSKMTLKVIFGQRHEEYTGQYGPEALDVVDEFSFDENPDYIMDLLKIHQENNEFENVALIDIEVDMEKIQRILNQSEIVPGEVK